MTEPSRLSPEALARALKPLTDSSRDLIIAHCAAQDAEIARLRQDLYMVQLGRDEAGAALDGCRDAEAERDAEIARLKGDLDTAYAVHSQEMARVMAERDRARTHVEKLRAALGFDDPTHAYHNLDGAIIDIDHADGRCDAVSMRTLKRVKNQLAKARAALAETEPKP